jgi:hypothetical protein
MHVIIQILWQKLLKNRYRYRKLHSGTVLIFIFLCVRTSYSCRYTGGLRMPKHGLPAAALPRLHRVSGLPRGCGGGGVHLGHPVEGAGGGLLLGCRHRHRGTPALLHGAGCQAIRYRTSVFRIRDPVPF